MIRYILKRILQAVPLLLVISFIVFTLIHLAPYDAIDAQITSNMSQEEINILIHEFGHFILHKQYLLNRRSW